MFFAKHLSKQALKNLAIEKKRRQRKEEPDKFQISAWAKQEEKNWKICYDSKVSVVQGTSQVLDVILLEPTSQVG